MKIWNLILILVLVAGVLAGGGGDDASSVEEQGSSAQDLESSADNEGYTSEALDTSYEGALPASSQLALGTFELEGTENAITPEQAKTLLPLWQAIQGGSLQSDVETDAVVKQIERAMTPEQLAAIAAMQLTLAGMGTWMQEQGVSFGLPPGAEGRQNPFGTPGGVSEEERAAMRATAQAGSGMPGGGGAFGMPGGMSEEERAAMRATAEAGGMAFGGGRGPAGAGSGQLAMMAAQVVELLTARAAQ
jgi:hypothetical protein